MPCVELTVVGKEWTPVLIPMAVFGLSGLLFVGSVLVAQEVEKRR